MIEDELTPLFERLGRMSVPLTVADPGRDDCPLIFANPAFEALTGHDLHDIRGLNCRFLQCEKTDRDAVAQIRNAIERRVPVTTSLMNRRKDGTEFVNMLLLEPLRVGAGGHFIYVGSQFHVRTTSTVADVEERMDAVDDAVLQARSLIDQSRRIAESSYYARANKALTAARIVLRRI